MSAPTCMWRGSDQPRAVRGRHANECESAACRGCWPCEEPHCVVCGREHVLGACVECTGAARDDLAEIARLSAALPTEVAHRGVESEAMNLLGPAADPEAWGHLAASLRVGRVAYVPCPTCAEPWPCEKHAAGESHPLFVLGTWDMVWRDALEHDEPADRLTIATAADYLDRQLTYMAGFADVPFEDFARDVRRCRAHLEDVLHAGERVDTGAPCMRCEKPLVREWGERGREDGWRCPRCRSWSNDEQYRLAVAHLHREEAAWLTDRDMEIRTGVKAGTVRSWARTAATLVRKRTDAGRTLYAVEDVEEAAREKGLVGGACNAGQRPAQ